MRVDLDGVHFAGAVLECLKNVGTATRTQREERRFIEQSQQVSDIDAELERFFTLPVAVEAVDAGVGYVVDIDAPYSGP